MRELPLKDQPIDNVEFERLWEEIGELWRMIEWYEIESSFRDKELLAATRRLQEIKHRFFNQLVY